MEISISRRVIDVCKLDIKDSRKGGLVTRVNIYHNFREKAFFPMDSVIFVRILLKKRMNADCTPVPIHFILYAMMTSLSA